MGFPSPPGEQPLRQLQHGGRAPRASQPRPARRRNSFAGAPISATTGATSACPTGRGSAEAAAGSAGPDGSAALSNGSAESPLVVLSVPCRSRGAGRTRGTTNGRCEFDLHPDPDAARRAVAIPAAAVNRFPDFDALHISGLDVVPVKRIEQSTAKVVTPLSPVAHSREPTVTWLSGTWNGTSRGSAFASGAGDPTVFLQKVANNSAAYHKVLAKKGQAVQAAAAAAKAGGAPLPSPTRPLPLPPTRSLPPLSTSSPAARAGSGTDASDHETVDRATCAQSDEDFFASHR